MESLPNIYTVPFHQPSNTLSTPIGRPIKITLENIWLASPFFIILVKALRVPLPLLDFWWHVKMGQIILSSHSIPRTDLFSFTAAGKPFIVQNWLAEFLYYKLYQLGGPPLLVFLNAVLLATALLPVVLLCRESTRRTRLVALSAVLACLAFSDNARPQVFSFVLFAFFYWILDGYRFHRRDRVWFLPVFMIVWVNLHGAFVVGLCLIGVFLGSESIRRILDSSGEDILSDRELRKLGLVFAACAAVTLLNPETYRIYEYIRVVLTDRSSQLLVMEWQPPRIDTLLGVQMFWGLFGMAVFGLIYRRRRQNLTDLALFWVFAIFGLTALRNAIWFAIVIAPLLARYLDNVDIWNLLPHVGFPAATEKPLPRPHYKLNLALAVASFVILALSSPWVRSRMYPGCLFEPQTPVKAVDYIKLHKLRGSIFHPQIFGDYLIWRLYPLQRSFIDGRVHLFGEPFVREYRNIFYDSHWEEMLAPFNIQYLLLSKDQGQAESINLIQRAGASRNWTTIYEDDVSILFSKANR